MNKIQIGETLYKPKFYFKIPFTIYWIVYLEEIHVFEIVCKYFDNKGYYFNRIGHNYRPE